MAKAAGSADREPLGARQSAARRFFAVLDQDLEAGPCATDLGAVVDAVGDALGRLEKLTEFVLAQGYDLDESGLAPSTICAPLPW